MADHGYLRRPLEAPVADFDAATRIYRSRRRNGVTPRGFVDCMIASVAARHDAALLAADDDVLRIAEIVGIPVDDGAGAGG